MPRWRPWYKTRLFWGLVFALAIGLSLIGWVIDVHVGV
jgi:hypothetical protein